MTEKVKVSCPSCAKDYSIPVSQLGKKATCKKCGESFVLARSDVPAEVIFDDDEKMKTQQVQDSSDSEIAQPQGFFGRMKAKATEAIDSAKETAAATLRATFVSGPFDIDKGSNIVISQDGSSLKVSAGVTGSREVATIPMESVASVECDNSDSLTIQIQNSAPLVVGKFIGNSVEGMAEKVLRWVSKVGVISEDDLIRQREMITATAQQEKENQKAMREGEMLVRFLHGPFHTKTNSQMFLQIDGTDLIASSLKGFTGRKEEFRIRLSKVKGTEIDTSERMTIARAAFLGIFAFGMKKKDKLLRVDFDDSGAEANLLFGKGAGISLEEVSGRILAARRGVQSQSLSEETPTQPKVETQSVDITDSIKKLAVLRDQGILTDEEFAAKKTELLSRM